MCTYLANTPRFVDRDMMMRYLGLGVGHRHPAEFPHEDDELRAVPNGDNYVYTDWDCATEDEGLLDEDEDDAGQSDEQSFDDEEVEYEF